MLYRYVPNYNLNYLHAGANGQQSLTCSCIKLCEMKHWKFKLANMQPLDKKLASLKWWPYIYYTKGLPTIHKNVNFSSINFYNYIYSHVSS